MPKRKPGAIIPSAAEDADINRGIALDSENPELTDADFRQMKRIGRPPIANRKVAVSIRLDQDVLNPFKQSGEGWQTRVNAALKDWLRDHRPADI